MSLFLLPLCTIPLVCRRKHRALPWCRCFVLWEKQLQRVHPSAHWLLAMQLLTHEHMRSPLKAPPGAGIVASSACAVYSCPVGFEIFVDAKPTASGVPSAEARLAVRFEEDPPGRAANSAQLRRRNVVKACIAALLSVSIAAGEDRAQPSVSPHEQSHIDCTASRAQAAKCLASFPSERYVAALSLAAAISTDALTS